MKNVRVFCSFFGYAMLKPQTASNHAWAATLKNARLALKKHLAVHHDLIASWVIHGEGRLGIGTMQILQ